MNDKELVKKIINRILENAIMAKEDHEREKSEFNDSRMLAYYEILDSIKNELILNDEPLAEYNMDFKLETLL